MKIKEIFEIFKEVKGLYFMSELYYQSESIELEFGIYFIKQAFNFHFIIFTFHFFVEFGRIIKEKSS